MTLYGPREAIRVLSLPGDDALRSPMKKTFLLHIDGRKADLALSSVTHEVHKYVTENVSNTAS